MHELLIFGAGVLIGAGSMYAHARAVRKVARAERERGEHAVAVARGESARLQDVVTAYAVEAERCRRDTAIDNAYRDGFKFGRQSPEGAAESFARNFEGHRGAIVFKGLKG